MYSYKGESKFDPTPCSSRDVFQMVRQISRDPESISLRLKGYNITQSEDLVGTLGKFLKHKKKKIYVDVQTESTFSS